MNTDEPEDKSMRIGKVAKKTDVAVPTLRYYEREGLMPDPPREASSSYRSYPRSTVQRVRFISQARELGFSLEQIRELLQLEASSEDELLLVDPDAEMTLRIVSADDPAAFQELSSALQNGDLSDSARHALKQDYQAFLGLRTNLPR